MGRYAVRNRILDLDPAVDFREICRLMTTFEFPWDMNQALSFALFRTYAVPSIGRLLDETGAFARDTQKRYDDTVVLLDDTRDGVGAEQRERQGLVHVPGELERRHQAADLAEVDGRVEIEDPVADGVAAHVL